MYKGVNVYKKLHIVGVHKKDGMNKTYQSNVETLLLPAIKPGFVAGNIEFRLLFGFSIKKYPKGEQKSGWTWGILNLHRYKNSKSDE